MEVKKTPAGERAGHADRDAIHTPVRYPESLVSSLRSWHLWAITKSSKRDLMGEDAARL